MTDTCNQNEMSLVKNQTISNSSQSSDDDDNFETASQKRLASIRGLLQSGPRINNAERRTFENLLKALKDKRD